MVSGWCGAGVMRYLYRCFGGYLKTGRFAREGPLTNEVEAVPPAPAGRGQSLARSSPRFTSRFPLALEAGDCFDRGFRRPGFDPCVQFGKGVKLNQSPRKSCVSPTIPRAPGNRSGILPARRMGRQQCKSLALRYLLERKSLRETDQIYRQATSLACGKSAISDPSKGGVRGLC